ncbi:MAG: phosphoglycerate kinase [Patescibacteria group bacterium]
MQEARITRGTRVLVRLDLNVPMEKGRVSDDSRIVAALATLTALTTQGARVRVLTHLGRPEGKRVTSLSVAPIAEHLSRLVKASVTFAAARVGTPALTHVLDAQQPGTIVVLENIRFYPGEDKNDATFGKELAALGDVYVNDGFSVCHRAAASVVAVTRHLPSYAGLQLEREVAELSQVFRPQRPAVLIIGGVKIETKLPVIEALGPKFDAILLGGGVANTVLASQKYDVGNSVCDTDYLREALALTKKKEVYVPVDVAVGKAHEMHVRHVAVEHRPHTLADEALSINDIGPATIAQYREIIETAQTIVWNGPLGMFERREYQLGTLAIMAAVGAAARRGAHVVIGGGETVDAARRHHMVQYIRHVSTGGGAMLEFLSGTALPGISALTK